MYRYFVFFTLLFNASAQPAHFEARLTRPIGLTPDGRTLLALNTPDSSLSQFDVTDSSQPVPVLLREIAVGLDPVSLRARTNDEVWVVNEVSDSVSVVSLSTGNVMDTLQVGDEPADVYFAAGKAFVSCAGNRQLRVFDAVSRAALGTISLQGIAPRAMVASADGSKLYVAFLLSGNGTTILPRELAPPPPAPTNPVLPAAPQTALIVPASDSRISWQVMDHDIAEVDTSSLAVTRYLSGVGTHLFDLQRHPNSGELWIPNSESLNLTRFEPDLKGQLSIHRLSRVAATGTASPLHFDLNPGIARATSPQPASISLSLAQPTGVVFNSDGSRAWTAAFNSDRVAEINTSDGNIVGRIDVRTGPVSSSAAMRGPRGLVISADGGRLFVLNKLSNSISVVGTASRSVLAEIPTGSHDPTPQTIRQGRGFLFDARLSGNGTISCATCHLDADRDGLAWDLGDPNGTMVTVPGAALSAHRFTVSPREMHPMKGPMVTQTLRGLATNTSTVTHSPTATVTKFHWRGDKPSIQSFNATFADLMGGNPIGTADMDALAAYLLTIRHHPNPNRNLDRSLPVSLNGGNAVAGRALFNDHLTSHCISCHAVPGGTDQNIDLKREVNGTQEMKNPSLRTVYQRADLFNPVTGQASLAGFGLGSDGVGSALPLPHFYQLDNLSTVQQIADLKAFLLCFDTGTAPVVGRSVTFLPSQAAASSAVLSLLESQALAAACDLVVRVKIAGFSRRFRFQPTSGKYLSDRANEAAITSAALIGRADSQPMTFLGVATGDGARLGGDHDLDGILDGDEPLPSLQIRSSVQLHQLSWPSSASDWFPQSATHPAGPWQTWTAPISQGGNFFQADSPLPADPVRFFRLKSTRK